MKRIIIVLLPAILCAASLQVNAQSTPEQRAEKITTWMKDSLKLTPEQVPQAQEINLKYARMNEDLKTSPGSRKEKFKKVKSNDDAKDGELKKLFTAKQYKLYISKKEELKEKLKERHKGKKL